MASISIPLTQGEFALIDEEDAPLVGQFRWCLQRGRKTLYATRGERVPGKKWPRLILMHRVILGAEPGEIVDHINGNGLDNRRANLRKATKSQNAANAGSHRDATSVYRGVNWDKRRRKWLAQICKAGRITRLGSFNSEVDAAHAYDRAAVEFFGEFASLNFPESNHA